MNIMLDGKAETFYISLFRPIYHSANNFDSNVLFSSWSLPRSRIYYLVTYKQIVRHRHITIKATDIPFIPTECIFLANSRWWDCYRVLSANSWPQWRWCYCIGFSIIFVRLIYNFCVSYFFILYSDENSFRNCSDLTNYL